jgi:tetratricopeptide (TPR) repeat protein
MSGGASHWAELNQAGEDAYASGDFAAARSSFEQARSEAEAKRLNLELASTLNNLGLVYRADKNYKDSEAALSKAVSLREQALGIDADCTGVALNNLAELYFDEGRTKLAETTYKRALQSVDRAGSDAVHAAKVFNNLGAFYYSQKQFATAEPYLHRALDNYKAIRKGAGAKDPGKVLMATLAQANGDGIDSEEDTRIKDLTEALLNIYLMDRSYSKFRELYVEFVREKSKESSNKANAAAHAFAQRADALAKEGNRDDAEAMYNRSLAAYEAAGELGSPDALATKSNYEAFLRRQKGRIATP